MGLEQWVSIIQNKMKGKENLFSAPKYPIFNLWAISEMKIYGGKRNSMEINSTVLNIISWYYIKAKLFFCSIVQSIIDFTDVRFLFCSLCKFCPINKTCI